MPSWVECSSDKHDEVGWSEIVKTLQTAIEESKKPSQKRIKPPSMRSSACSNARQRIQPRTNLTSKVAEYLAAGAGGQGTPLDNGDAIAHESHATIAEQ